MQSESSDKRKAVFDGLVKELKKEDNKPDTSIRRKQLGKRLLQQVEFSGEPLTVPERIELAKAAAGQFHSFYSLVAVNDLCDVGGMGVSNEELAVPMHAELANEVVAVCTGKKTVEALQRLWAGVDVLDLRTGEGLTPLMVSFRNLGYNMDSVEGLVEAGANLNATDREGRTALDHAALLFVSGETDDVGFDEFMLSACCVLLENGASPFAGFAVSFAHALVHAGLLGARARRLHCRNAGQHAERVWASHQALLGDGHRLHDVGVSFFTLYQALQLHPDLAMWLPTPGGQRLLQLVLAELTGLPACIVEGCLLPCLVRRGAVGDFSLVVDQRKVFGEAAAGWDPATSPRQNKLLDADALSVHSPGVCSLKGSVRLQSKEVCESRLRDIARVQALLFEDPETVKNLGMCNGGAYHHMHGPDILQRFQLV